MVQTSVFGVDERIEKRELDGVTVVVMLVEGVHRLVQQKQLVA